MAQAIMDKFTKNVFKEKSIIDPNKKLRAAVVGIGWIAEAQVSSYLRCEDVDLARPKISSKRSVFRTKA